MFLCRAVNQKLAWVAPADSFPLPLLLQVHGNTDLEPAVFSSESRIFSFFSAVLILSPCFILSRLSQKLQYSTRIPQRASQPWFQYILFCTSFLFLLLTCRYPQLHPANPKTTPKYLYSIFTSILLLSVKKALTIYQQGFELFPPRHVRMVLNFITNLYIFRDLTYWTLQDHSNFKYICFSDQWFQALVWKNQIITCYQKPFKRT